MQPLIFKNIAFTIVTEDYLAHAKTLGDSLLLYNPEYLFIIALIGTKVKITNLADFQKFKIIDIGELSDERVPVMGESYTPFELSCALKPYFCKHILTLYSQVRRVKYFDSDILVLHRFDLDIESDEQHSIFLTPHYLRPIPPESASTSDINLIKYGVYNAGFFEVANTEETSRFLEWWKDRLAAFCFFKKEPYSFIFVDQSWLNLVPVFFKNVYIIKEAGYNLAFYNIHENTIKESGDGFLFNECKPVVFFHFTGYRFYDHESASKGHPDYNFETTPVLRALCEKYRDLLFQNNVQMYYTQPVSDLPDLKVHSILTRISIIINSALTRVLKVKIVRVN